MDNQMDFGTIRSTTQEPNEAFTKLIQPYRSDLWRYCNYLRGSPWEAEDLVQETLLKAFASLTRVSQTLAPKTYLFRIASNTWVDQCRRNKIDVQTYELELLPSDVSIDQVEIKDAIELLTLHLTPKQLAVFLLFEAFGFTAKETAGIVGSTEGAVHSNMRIARKKIKAVSRLDDDHSIVNQLDDTERKITEKYMKAFIDGDFEMIGSLLDEHATNHIVGTGMDFGKTQIRSNSMGDWASGPRAIEIQGKLVSLWGRHVVIFTRTIDSQEKLWDVTEIEMEEKKIIKHKSHYFCKDLLVQVANELYIGMDESKDLFGFPW